MNVMETLNNYYLTIMNKYPHNAIVGVFLYGSQNYNLDHADSDVDAIAILTPSWEDILMCRTPIATTVDEHIKVRDVRLVLRDLDTPHLANIEWLFTDYYILGPMFEDHVIKLRKERELIAAAHRQSGVDSMIMMAISIARDATKKLAAGEVKAARRMAARLYFIDSYLEEYAFGGSVATAMRKANRETYFYIRALSSTALEAFIPQAVKAIEAYQAIHNTNTDAALSIINATRRSIVKFALGDNGYGKA